MSMTRAFRNDVGAVFAALGVASFGMFIWLHYYYVAYYPKTPNPELGLVHLFRNKGSFAYVSDADLTEMSLLMIAFVVCFLVGFAIVPRRLVLKPYSPQYIGLVRPVSTTDAPTLRHKVIFVCSAALYVALVWLKGNSIAAFAVSQGVVLNFS
jgi:hypothetical protein